LIRKVSETSERQRKAQSMNNMRGNWQATRGSMMSKNCAGSKRYQYDIPTSLIPSQYHPHLRVYYYHYQRTSILAATSWGLRTAFLILPDTSTILMLSIVPRHPSAWSWIPRPTIPISSGMSQIQRSSDQLASTPTGVSISGLCKAANNAQRE